MEQKTGSNRLWYGIRAFLYAFLVFAGLIAVIGVLLRFTGLPETGIAIYVMGALSFSCLVLGLFAGYAMKKKGFLYGALFSIIFLLCILSAALLTVGSGLKPDPSQLRYLICVLCGMIGGMIGVNVRTA